MYLEDLRIDIYADGADADVMFEEYKKGIVKGFTTNPTLMKQAGITDYMQFIKLVMDKIKNMPISFEVFSDEFGEMEREAKVLDSYGENIFVKIPITNSKGESSVELIRRLSADKVKLNVTAVFTVEQARAAVEAFSQNSENIVSVFAGRIADTGEDAENIIREIVQICKKKRGTKCLWASCREVFNIIQADRCGADIITVTDDIMKKLSCFGKNLEKYSLETVQMFVDDGKKLGFNIL